MVVALFCFYLFLLNVVLLSVLSFFISLHYLPFLILPSLCHSLLPLLLILVSLFIFSSETLKNSKCMSIFAFYLLLGFTG